MWSRLANSLALACVLALPAVALAAQPDERTAEILFREGRKLLSENEYTSACEKLAQSQRLDPAPGTLILLAFCHEKLGRFATAHREYREAARLADRVGDVEKGDAARRFAEKIRDRQHVLVIMLDDPAAEVRVDDRTQAHSTKQVEVPLDPGVHSVVVGGKWRKDVTIPDAAGRTIVDVPKMASSSPGGLPEKRSFWSENAVGLTALGAGVVGLGVGTFFGLRAFSKNDDSSAECDEQERCTPRGRELRDEARTSAMISNVAFGVGIVGVGTGSFMLLSSGSGREATGLVVGAGGRF
jgi:hypothetical protein